MYPDPSVCRAGDKYYMVCSSFQFFPAVPLFESDDMVNWKQIGHCITRRSQLDLTGADKCSGIFAPTIRYHEGRFYMVTTEALTHTNFYVYTDDIYGEWSEPIRVDEEGIDPTLYFEDGKSYFIGNGYDEERGCSCIRMCEIDIETGEKLTPSKPLWHGTGGRFIEAPHLYKFGEYYYILDAEGGTEYGHMANYGRSKNMWGPFEPFPQNPVLTNRNLGGYILQGAGHGDVIEDKEGNWWFMHLAFRQTGQWMQYHHLGRECCLVPVTWKDGWFYMGDGTSRLSYEIPNLNADKQNLSYKKTFCNLSKGKDWIFLRNYREDKYHFEENALRLVGTPDTIFTGEVPTMAAVRQCEFCEEVSVNVSSECQEAGISVYADERHHYDLFVTKEHEAVLRLTIGNLSQEIKKVPMKGTIAALKISASEFEYRFAVETEGENVEMGIGETRYLSSEVSGGFTGVVYGLYAVDCADRSAKFSDLSIVHME